MGTIIRSLGFLAFIGIGGNLIFGKIATGTLEQPDFYQAAVTMHNRLQEMLGLVNERVGELLAFAGLQ